MEMNTEQITHYAKIALALIIAERVKYFLIEFADLNQISSNVIIDGWSWIKNGTPNPEEMYDSSNSQLIELDYEYYSNQTYEKFPKVKQAFHLILFAHYIAVCYSQAIERIRNPNVVYAVGNDVAEVNGQYFIDSISIFINLSEKKKDLIIWLEMVYNYLQKEHSIEMHGIIGSPIFRNEFEKFTSLR